MDGLLPFLAGRNFRLRPSSGYTSYCTYWRQRSSTSASGVSTPEKPPPPQLFLAAMLSQGFLVFGRSIAPEAPAVSLSLIAMSATLLAVPGEHWKRYLALAATAGAAACLLRPTMLPLVVMLPILFVLTTRITGRQISAVRIVVLQLALLLPLLVYTAERGRHTGDFRLVAFGGFQMSGMAGLLLSKDVVQRFPMRDRELAVQVLTAREHAEAAGRVLRTPLNSKGERSFVSAAVGYFDIYARTYDDLLYGEIIKLRSSEESWVDFDRRLQRFALITIMLAPERYAAWIVGASSRTRGAHDRYKCTVRTGWPWTACRDIAGGDPQTRQYPQSDRVDRYVAGRRSCRDIYPHRRAARCADHVSSVTVYRHRRHPVAGAAAIRRD